MPLRVAFVRSELRVVIQVPARELARRNAAGNRIQEPECPLRAPMAALEHGVVHDLVQQDGEVEDREALNQGERDPDQRMLEMDETPGRQREDCELPHRHDPVAPGVLAWSRRSSSRGRASPSSALRATACCE